MRKIITTTFVTLDGVMQAPGDPEEDTTGGFIYGGWQMSFPSDEMLDGVLHTFMTAPFELLLGRVTYDIFAAYWPTADAALEPTTPFNATKKYVVSRESFEPAWSNTTCITGDVVAQLQQLKEEDGPDLWVYGSGNLIQTLLTHNLIDRMYLWIYPLTLGTGKKLFAEGTPAESLRLTDSKVSSTTGVILATYEPVGPFRMNER